MDARLQRLTTEAIPLVHYNCARSVFWELCPSVQDSPRLDAAFEKEVWLATGLLEGDSGGFNLIHPRPTVAPIRSIATILYCNPAVAPGVVQLPSAPVSSDARLITSLHIDPVIADTGLETVMVDAVVMELVAAEVPAVEVFGLRSEAVADAALVADAAVARIAERAAAVGLIDVHIWESAGFMVVQDHPVLPRLRMELPPVRELLTALAAEELLNRIYA
ncbi:MAG: hypothetical protein Q4D85_07485 [Corynebacterium sp.]|uniref:hypothetical protein n=1 Tax=Corynebacterium sp. TaxID=1720 RepID=UPI0026DAE60A|nr:hypothetical protein [Corynebacterium sp.]MDO5098590.1 hypothetical protein [Corynebacterium sp.]